MAEICFWKDGCETEVSLTLSSNQYYIDYVESVVLDILVQHSELNSCFAPTDSAVCLFVNYYVLHVAYYCSYL